MKHLPLYIAILAVTTLMALQAAYKPSDKLGREAEVKFRGRCPTQGVCEPSPTIPQEPPGQG